MSRFISVLSVVTVATASVALAAPNDKKAPAPAPAPAKEAEPAPAAAGSGSGSGDAVAPIEDAPPADMEGRDENPDAPKGTEEVVAPTAAVVVKAAGYPIEETQRPITLPAAMAEVSIAPHFVVQPFSESDALRARYGITKQVQLGLTYVYGGVYDDPTTVKKTYGFHVGKAAGLDVTVLLTNWLGVKVGVPVYFDPVATSFAAGAPMKFVFGDKLAIGGLEDIVNIRISEFPPSLEFEQQNAVGAANKTNNTQQSRGKVRFSGFVEYQQAPKTAIIGRVGIETDLGGGGDNGPGTASGGGTRTFIRAGVQHSPKKNVDVGGGVGFEDLSDLGSFAVSAMLAFRI